MTKEEIKKLEEDLKDGKDVALPEGASVETAYYTITISVETYQRLMNAVVRDIRPLPAEVVGFILGRAMPYKVLKLSEEGNHQETESKKA